MYLLTAFTRPGSVITQLNRAIFAFLWKGETELISRETCYLPKQKGGLSIPDIQTQNIATKSKWIKHITDRTYHAKWVYFARYWLGIPVSTINPDWTWLRTTLQPQADPRTSPTSYTTVRKTLQSRRTLFSTIQMSTMNVKHIYEILTSADSEPPKAMQQKKILRSNNIENIWLEIWSGLAHNED